ncbi:tumor necrosis factor receptor superfamily member 1A precursor, partial [Silurus meridionalis]
NSNSTGSCLENEYWHNGFCCDMCPPGFKLTKACSGHGQRSTCEKCSPGLFLDSINYTPNCFSCRKPCENAFKEREIQNCTHIQNRICGCHNEYYQFVVEENTKHCLPCRKCGSGEVETRPCGGQMNTLCNCKFNHYRVAKGICALCTNCTSKCPEMCPNNVVMTTPSSTHLPGSPLEKTFILVGMYALIALMCIICLYNGAKHWRKKKPTLYSQSSVSCDSEKQMEKSETHTCIQIKEDESKLLAVLPETMLPDCIPKEIKIHEFIYFLLDIVPVNRFKELVRRLNVSEQDIDRAERDNRAFADAQYQMLMVWFESGTRVGKSILPHRLLQECLERLHDMNLSACAESIQEKYV